MLLHERHGDQLSMPPVINSEDVKHRLEWYKRRLGKDFERRISEAAFDKAVVSPIEQIFMMEWGFIDTTTGIPFTLEPQYRVPVGERTYKVDFLVTADGHPFKLGVELDGHDFHERTREQVRADNARERAIVRHGITVLRFSGSEVARNCRACVSEVVEFMQARTETA